MPEQVPVVASSAAAHDWQPCFHISRLQAERFLLLLLLLLLHLAWPSEGLPEQPLFVSCRSHQVQAWRRPEAGWAVEGVTGLLPAETEHPTRWC